MPKRKPAKPKEPATVTPTFTKVANGEIVITGLKQGVMYVDEKLLPHLLQMSIEGGLFPYWITTAVIDQAQPGVWVCVVEV